MARHVVYPCFHRLAAAFLKQVNIHDAVSTPVVLDNFSKNGQNKSKDFIQIYDGNCASNFFLCS